jgi:hypothetical protein
MESNPSQDANASTMRPIVNILLEMNLTDFGAKAPAKGM